MPLLSLMYWNAKSIRPPEQPWLPSFLEQSTRFCSLSDTNLFVFLKVAPSRLPVAEKAQQLPHMAWFFTPVTNPFVLQSTSAGRESVLGENTGFSWSTLSE